jgi:hypothetical protein
LLMAGIGIAAGGMTLAQHGGHGKGGVQVKLLSQTDIIGTGRRRRPRSSR